MAEKSVGYAPGDDPATIEANQKYQEALATLTNSLDTRKNRFFDPVWLAAAEGFLGPTKTGSFYESLGRVAGKVGTAEENAAKEDQLIAQQRVAATAANVDLQRQKGLDAALMGMFPPPATTTPTPTPASAPASPLAALSNKTDVAPPPAAGADGKGALSVLAQSDASATRSATPSAAPSPLVAANQAATPITPYVPPTTAISTTAEITPPIQRVSPKPLAETPVATTVAPAVAPVAPVAEKPKAEDIPPQPGYANQGFSYLPPDPNWIDPRKYAQIARYDKSKSPAEIIKEVDKLNRDRWEYKENYAIDRKTGYIYPSLSGKQVDATIFGDGEGKTYNIPESVALRLSQLMQNGDEAGYNKLAAQFTKGFGKGERSTSLQDRERQKKLSEADVAQEVEYRKDFNAKNTAAREVITNAEYFRNISKDPKADKMFGIFTNDKVSSAIANLVSEGVGMTNYTIGVPAIKKIMTNLGLDKKEDSAKLQVFLMNVAQQQLLSEKYLKGATSDRERNLLAEASINKDDTPTSIRMKADILTRRAKFDQDSYKAYKAAKRKSDISAEDFLDSKQYEDMFDSYVKELSKLSTGDAKLGRREDAPKGSGLSGAKARVDEVLGRGK